MLVADRYSAFGQSRDSLSTHKSKDTALAKIDSLAPVIVRPKAIRPRMKGDTLEYNTGNIILRPNANVEELLGRLPGLHVAPDGTITYNGEVINQLLVDGEDFFSSNPSLITRNFDADRIARVELLDRKSEMSRFTGIDDGNRTKTLNLVLKEDSRKGYFGKVGAGADPSGIYSADGLLASFRGHEQFAALGFASNTGNLGVSSNAGGISVATVAGLGLGYDPLGTSAGEGIPRIYAGVAHYANTWDGGDDHVNGDYKYGNMLTRPATTSKVVQTLPDSIYAQYKKAQSVNRQDIHAGYGNYDLVIDSLSALRFDFHLSSSEVKNGYSDSGNSSFNDILVNDAQRNIRSAGSVRNGGGAIEWKIRTRKRTGPVFFVTTGLGTTNNVTNGYIYSLNRFYLQDGQLASQDTVDQRKLITNRSKNYSLSLSLLKPLGKLTSIYLSWQTSNANSRYYQASYDKGDGKYLKQVDSLSNNYDEHRSDQTGNITLQNNGRRFNYSLSTEIFSYSYRQKDIKGDSTMNYHYLNLLPRLEVNFAPNSTTRFNFFYVAGAKLPSVDQLQSVKNNNDPLHIILGNPHLRPGFNQNWNFEFKQVRSWMMDVKFSFGVTSSSISTKTTTDTLGRQISQPVNVDGVRNMSFSWSVNKRVLGLDMSAIANVTYKQNVSYVNADLSRNNSYAESLLLNVGKLIPDKISINLSGRLGYMDNNSSINTSTPVRYWTQQHFAGVTLYFIKGFDINTYANYFWQQKTSVFGKSTSVLLWNTDVSRNFLSNLLVAKFQINNLLDQNSGISRSNTGNINTESFTNILGRYWLFSLTWRFDHKYHRK